MSTTQTEDDVEQKLQRLYDNLTAVEGYVENREYEQATEVAEEMESNAEETGCPLCMKTAIAVMSGIAWTQHLPTDDTDRREAFLESIRGLREDRVGAELSG